MFKRAYKSVKNRDSFSCIKNVCIIIFFICLNSFGQEFNPIKTRLSLLEIKNDFQLDSTGISKLILPPYDCYNNKLENGWHLQDFNFDGLKDLIYTGACQPYYQTAIFLKSEKEFKLVYDFPGKLISIKSNSNETKINILKSSCCCDYNSDLIEVSINEESEIRKNTISFHFETKVEVSGKLNSKTLTGVLRSTPVVDNNIKKDPCTENMVIGNQITEVENKLALVLNEKRDWFLVSIKTSETNSILGWIGK